jgi:DNA polymerase-3 subunit beta
MKAKVLREELAKALETVMPAVSTRATLPICQTVKIGVGDNGIVLLSATNLDIFITTKLAGQTESGPGICVTAKLFHEVVKSLSGDTVELDNQQSKNILKVNSSKFRSSFNCMNEDDFPSVPSESSNNSIELETSVIKQLARVSFACATEDTRPVLKGVCLNLSHNLIETAAADGFRLAVLSLPVEGQEIDGRFIIESHVMSILKKLANVEGSMKLSLGKRLLVSTPGVEIAANCIDGTFPDHHKLMPTEYKTTVTVVRQDLLNALKMAVVFNPTGVIKLKIEQGKPVSFECRSDDDNCNGVINAVATGENVDIAVGIRYATSAVESLECEKVVIMMNGKTEPMLFCSESDRLKTLVMPVFINW